MAEPIPSTVAVAVTGVGLASILPGVDGNALIGAFAGATLLVVSSKDLTLATRLAYLVISMIAGYQAAPDVVAWLPIRSTGMAAFFAAACAIAIALQLIERVKTADLLSFFRKKGG
ncbi:hypothetical protein GJV26_00070 [Massilia dura]|uniref:Phage holin n=1 Tax=Pseudoduganella dura TaxID=321982 RepID=A0A6I3XCJ5_9BURK|nr:putative holin [Pseudoduganella dura]MUI10892.1 hypothetical protein [Pseudoduganella dura]GGY12671.1 membrane protein [Pseudoduganella dura]